jgi:hypothetical protein
MILLRPDQPPTTPINKATPQHQNKSNQGTDCSDEVTDPERWLSVVYEIFSSCDIKNQSCISGFALNRSIFLSNHRRMSSGVLRLGVG